MTFSTRHRWTSRWVAWMLVLAASPALALPVPSRTQSDQRSAAAQAELDVIYDVLAREEVFAALAAQGLTADQVEQRLAQLSADEVHHLANHLDQLQAAGANVPQYIWILLAVLLGVLIVTAIA